MNIQYSIHGGVPLSGETTISGSKNAALPLLAASLLCEGTVTFTNVPQIRDVHALLSILTFLGAQTLFEGNTVQINTDNVQSRVIPEELVSKFRASILLLGPLLARFGVVEMGYPGGCVIGKRPVDVHLSIFEQLGATNMGSDDVLHLQGELHPHRIFLSEFSVTATENALLASALLEGESRIDLAACEPHVQDLCHFLVSAGVEIDGIGSHTLRIRGKKNLSPPSHRVIPDDLETGFLICAALATRGDVRLREVEREHLLFFLETVRRAGGHWVYDEKDKVLHIDGEQSRLVGTEVQTNIFPGFQTDLLPPFGVVLSQARGVSRLFERLYERRMAYLYELEKMGSRIEFLNPHQALVIGPTPLRGRTVASNDIRAGAAMVVAGLTAQGETIITDVQYIERGYNDLPQKLISLGARIDIIRPDGLKDETSGYTHGVRSSSQPTQRENPVHTL